MAELRRRTSSAAKEAAASVAASVNMAVDTQESKSLYLSTGSTLLNLALTDKWNGGWKMGTFVNIIGDSSSGKSLCSLTTLAEAVNNPLFDNYKIIYDDVEAANSFDIPALFGNKLYERMEAPRYTENDEPIYSNTVEDWYANVHRLIQSNIPFVYILDSVDALTSNAEISRADEYVDAQDKDKEIGGSYKMDKAKLLSEILRVITGEIAKTQSLVIAISQTRDNVNPQTARFSPKTRAGGKALKFYATHELWLNHIGNVDNTKYKRKIGDRSEIKVSKNKITGKVRKVPITIYYSYGIDDITENIDFLLETGIAKKTSSVSIDMESVCGLSGTKANIVEALSKDREKQRLVAEAVHRAWNDIEDSIKVTRTPKYE